jgi:hypothetical protein
MIEKNDNYDDVMYQLQRQAVIIDVNNLQLIKDPSDELIHLGFSCDAMKFINGVPQKKLTGDMLILKIKYESNLLKQKMTGYSGYDFSRSVSKKRKYYDFT